MAVRFLTSGFVLAVVSTAALGRAQESEKPGATADRIAIVRATYAQVPPTILEVKEPIRVTQCAEQQVPVIFNLVFTDAEGANHSFSWHLDPAKSQNREFDRVYRVRYTGPSPLGQDLFRLPVRGPEEVALYALLLRWTAAQEQAKDLTLFDQEMLKNVNALLKKLDDRLAGEKPVAQKW
jgi:hypothetical protein